MDMPGPGLAFLAPLCGPPRLYPAGAMVFHLGDPAAGLHLLQSGEVHLLRRLPDGGEAVVHRAHPGESFAEAAVFAERYHCDAVAATEARIRLVPKAALQQALAAEPAFAAAFAARLAGQIQALRARVEILATRGAAERLMAFLGQQARDGVADLGRPMKQVAAEIGLTHEVLYRTLARLQREGRISRCGPSRYRLPGARLEGASA